MTRPHPTLVVGLDACDCETAQELARSGQMPVLRGLLGKAARCPMRVPPGLFVSALWPSFATGLRADRHGFHCWDEIEVATYERRLTTPRRTVGDPFWRRLGAAGRTIVSIDVPHTQAGGNGLEIAEWGCHDRYLGLQSWPPGERAIVERDFGLHPILGMTGHEVRAFAPDDYIHRAGPVRTPTEEKLMTDGLLAGLETKGRLSERYLKSLDWDLFITVFGESHAIGHQQWHLHDPDHPRFDPALQRFVGGDPVARVYAGLDAALGKLLAAVGDRVLVLVLLSHGMGPHYDGTHLLDEVLRRIDHTDRMAAEGARWDSAWKRAFHAFPLSLQRAALRLALPELRRRVRRRGLTPCAEFVTAAERAEQRFFLAPNNTVYAGVRLNRSGREPKGRVPADAVSAVSAALERDLRALVNVDTGARVIRKMERADRWYRRSDADTIPDLFFDWEKTAPIETVWSAKTGFVHAPYRNWRTGDHKPRGLLLAAGPGIPMGSALPEMAIEDLPASLTARFGGHPSDMDGQPAAWLLG